MTIRRIQRKIDRTPEQLAGLNAIRDKFQREKPSLDDLGASGDFDEPSRHGDTMALLSAIAALKHERERHGLTLAEVSDRSGLDKGMLSRLENGKILNPTITTLWRYAAAVGARVSLVVEEEPAHA